MPVSFVLTPDEAKILQRDVNGQGGLQSFMRRLQAKFDPASREIELDDDEVGRIVRMIGYGPGGFETRLRDVFRRPLREAIG
ncbi:hypothetical protein [Paracoccus yeei]|uniref:hypothetical protein n=1 Tax=Paracoccus yeei TaxID=147645 RepID=UPI00174B05A4|nr:hypothetical protein [Paracoccus yeei]